MYIHGAFQESKANEEMRSITRRRSSLNATKCTHPHQQKVTQPLVESCDAAREELNDRRLIALQKLDSNVVRRAREGDSHTRAKIAWLHAKLRALTLKVDSGFVQVVDTQADREHKGSRGAGNCVNSSGPSGARCLTSRWDISRIPSFCPTQGWTGFWQRYIWRTMSSALIKSARRLRPV